MSVSVREIQCVPTETGHRASASIDAGSRRYHVWFTWPGPACPAPADAFLTISLLAAMRLGQPLQVDGGVSARLLRNARLIQDVLRCWDPNLPIVDVEAAMAVPVSTAPKARDVGATFSGGVDAFYTVLKHPEIRTLLFVHGLDVPLRRTAFRNLVSTKLGSAAARLGRDFVEVETNARSFSERFMPWHYSYGAVLAAVGMLLAGRLERMYFASGQTYRVMLPDGANPVLIPMFSTDHIMFESDGCEYSRAKKAAAIADSEPAMDTLRVCFDNPNDAYNCGRCEKCLRTMASLEIAGALGRCRTFDRPLEYRRLARQPTWHPSLRCLVEDNLDDAVRSNASPDLIAALRRALNPPLVERLARRLPDGALRSLVGKWWRFATRTS